MKLTETIKYFGLSPFSKDLDAYLTSIEVPERPVFNKQTTERVSVHSQGYSLIFKGRVGYEKTWGKARDDGDMIFCQVQVYSEYNDSEFACYTQPLPYGLTFKSTLATALSIFGEPATDHKSGPENHVYVWYNYEGITASICFLPDNKGISFVQLEKAMLRAPQKLDW